MRIYLLAAGARHRRFNYDLVSPLAVIVARVVFKVVNAQVFSMGPSLLAIILTCRTANITAHL